MRCIALMPAAMQETLNIAGIAEQLQRNITALDESLSRTISSTFTQQLVGADEVCDNSIRFLTIHTQSYLYSHDKAKRDAGELLYNVIKQHIPQVSNLGYINEMAKIKALHTELQKTNLANAAKTIGVEEAIAHMINSRDAFETLYLQKNMAEKDKTATLSTKDASNAVLTSLQELIDKLNAHLLLNPTEELSQLKSSFNSVIDSVSKASK